jgi:hypothetical protein
LNILSLVLYFPAGTKIGSGKARWSVSQANEWYSNQSEWLVGCNFLPSNAANQVGILSNFRINFSNIIEVVL